MQIQAANVKVDSEASSTGGTDAQAHFVDRKDDLHSWLTQFERSAAMSQWASREVNEFTECSPNWTSSRLLRSTFTGPSLG
ncbi:hypothetical protein PoB_000922000 [Plakobranchus ocellatus]|uniref:Uncharacterized protein n=1 Tax=Plakobranchus ocellatus TaxID=259542 RepID=A0AAV3YI02_9GAST|nr:hypothetical protein PoB_000922000 [Plakobranchus ocellatus]